MTIQRQTFKFNGITLYVGENGFSVQADSGIYIIDASVWNTDKHIRIADKTFEIKEISDWKAIEVEKEDY